MLAMTLFSNFVTLPKVRESREWWGPKCIKVVSIAWWTTEVGRHSDSAQLLSTAIQTTASISQNERSIFHCPSGFPNKPSLLLLCRCGPVCLWRSDPALLPWSPPTHVPSSLSIGKEVVVKKYCSFLAFLYSEKVRLCLKVSSRPLKSKLGLRDFMLLMKIFILACWTSLKLINS